MFNSNSGLTASDIAAVVGNENGFGGNNGWWVLIILMFLCGGWGNRSGFGGGSGAAEDYVLASDFANIERKIDGVNNGLCDGFYAMNTGMLNGFAGVNTAIMQLGNNTMAGQTAISNQLATCCCENKQAIADLKYVMATTANDIMMNCNANYRALHDENIRAQMEAKDAQIAELKSAAYRADLKASQCEQSAYIVDQLRPRAIPAYTVANPYSYCQCNGCNG